MARDAPILAAAAISSSMTPTRRLCVSTCSWSCGGRPGMPLGCIRERSCGGPVEICRRATENVEHGGAAKTTPNTPARTSAIKRLRVFLSSRSSPRTRSISVTGTSANLRHEPMSSARSGPANRIRTRLATDRDGKPADRAEPAVVLTTSV